MAEDVPIVPLRSEGSDGHVAIVELIGGGRPPLHRHDFDEAFYVLEGELTFQLGDSVTRGAGELAFAPGGAPDTYANLSGAPAHALLVITPAGFERYFARMAAERQGGEPPPWRCNHSRRSPRSGRRSARSRSRDDGHRIARRGRSRHARRGAALGRATTS
jgi:quercetin dioxygenase-like cupin family protein